MIHENIVDKWVHCIRSRLVAASAEYPHCRQHAEVSNIRHRPQHQPLITFHRTAAALYYPA